VVLLDLPVSLICRPALLFTPSACVELVDMRSLYEIDKMRRQYSPLIGYSLCFNLKAPEGFQLNLVLNFYIRNWQGILIFILVGPV
jgi:hypothetical protein